MYDNTSLYLVGRPRRLLLLSVKTRSFAVSLQMLSYSEPALKYLLQTPRYRAWRYLLRTPRLGMHLPLHSAQAPGTRWLPPEPGRHLRLHSAQEPEPGRCLLQTPDLGSHLLLQPAQVQGPRHLSL